MLQWAEAEGWNPGLDDAAPFHASDPAGFFLALDGETAVAAISVVNHSDTLAFLGLYICRPEYRGQGVGYALWRHALDHAGQRTVGLDGVPDQQDNYRKSGFVLTGQTVRFEGNVSPDPDAPLRQMTGGDMAGLVALDTAANGYAKPAFLSGWLSPSATRETFVLDTGAGAMGFATVRRCGRGAKIGPLTAPDMDGARALLHGIAARWPDSPLIIDVPDAQPDLTAHCTRVGMAPAFHTARMYRGLPPTPGALIASAGTLELG